MTLQLGHSEFPYIWGKFDFLFYQCGGQKTESVIFVMRFEMKRIVMKKILRPPKNFAFLWFWAFCESKLTDIFASSIPRHQWLQGVSQSTFSFGTTPRLSFHISSKLANSLGRPPPPPNRFCLVRSMSWLQLCQLTLFPNPIRGENICFILDFLPVGGGSSLL